MCIRDSPERADIYKKFDLDIISGTILVAAMIRDKIIENRFTGYLIETGELGVIEIIASKNLEGKRVSDLNIPDEFSVVVIERKKKVIITETFTRIELDDKIMGLVRTTSLKKVKAIFKL